MKEKKIEAGRKISAMEVQSIKASIGVLKALIVFLEKLIT